MTIIYNYYKLMTKINIIVYYKHFNDIKGGL